MNRSEAPEFGLCSGSKGQLEGSAIHGTCRYHDGIASPKGLEGYEAFEVVLLGDLHLLRMPLYLRNIRPRVSCPSGVPASALAEEPRRPNSTYRCIYVHSYGLISAIRNESWAIQMGIRRRFPASSEFRELELQLAPPARLALRNYVGTTKHSITCSYHCEARHLATELRCLDCCLPT